MVQLHILNTHSNHSLFVITAAAGFALCLGHAIHSENSCC